jgi:hypothetical protein
VFDNAYTVYHQFAKWTEQKIWFVTRMKGNADYHVTKVLLDKTKKKAKGILKEQYITVAVKQNGAVIKRLKLGVSSLKQNKCLPLSKNKRNVEKCYCLTRMIGNYTIQIKQEMEWSIIS